MSATSASSLILPSLKPKTLFLSNPRPISLSLFSLSHKLHAKPLFCSAHQSFKRFTKKSSFSASKFVRNVSVSSEYGQEEELFGSDDGERAPSFSPDLKLFVGNLPFSVDSAQLAGLFGSAGNVEMVEVLLFYFLTSILPSLCFSRSLTCFIFFIFWNWLLNVDSRPQIIGIKAGWFGR